MNIQRAPELKKRVIPMILLVIFGIIGGLCLFAGLSLLLLPEEGDDPEASLATLIFGVLAIGLCFYIKRFFLYTHTGEIRHLKDNVSTISMLDRPMSIWFIIASYIPLTFFIVWVVFGMYDIATGTIEANWWSILWGLFITLVCLAMVPLVLRPMRNCSPLGYYYNLRHTWTPNPMACELPPDRTVILHKPLTQPLFIAIGVALVLFFIFSTLGRDYKDELPLTVGVIAAIVILTYLLAVKSNRKHLKEPEIVLTANSLIYKGNNIALKNLKSVALFSGFVQGTKPKFGKTILVFVPIFIDGEQLKQEMLYEVGPKSHNTCLFVDIINYRISLINAGDRQKHKAYKENWKASEEQPKVNFTYSANAEAEGDGEAFAHVSINVPEVDTTPDIKIERTYSPKVTNNKSVIVATRKGRPLRTFEKIIYWALNAAFLFTCFYYIGEGFFTFLLFCAFMILLGQLTSFLKNVMKIGMDYIEYDKHIYHFSQIERIGTLTVNNGANPAYALELHLKSQPQPIILDISGFDVDAQNIIDFVNYRFDKFKKKK